MNLLAQAKQFAGGAEAIIAWLGSGGEVVDKETAQARANLCLNCAKNVPVGIVKGAIADAARKALEIKARLKLRVQGEKALGKCELCDCVLRLLIHEPQSRIEPYLNQSDKNLLPAFCWKLKKE